MRCKLMLAKGMIHLKAKRSYSGRASQDRDACTYIHVCMYVQHPANDGDAKLDAVLATVYFGYTQLLEPMV